MDFVGVDIGASGTRYVTSRGHIAVAPNNMVKLPLDKQVFMEPYSSDPEAALELLVTRKVNGALYGQWHVLYGQMASRYSGNNETPTLLQSKYEQEINVLSAIMAAALGVMKDGLSSDLGLYVALPPAEVKGSLDKVIEKFGGEYEVNFIKLNRVVTLRFHRVMAYEESFMALLDFFFQMNGALRPEAAKYGTGNLLSLDIGASTTDLAIVQDMQYMEHTGRTIKVGGNVTRQIMQDWVVQNYGFDAPDATLEQAIAEGRIQMGNGYDDCSEAVKMAKRELAKSIVNQVQSYFRSVNIPIQTLRAIVVSGGGSMQGSYVNENNEEVVTSPSVSEYITEYLLQICGNVEVEQMKQSPRLANVTGLFIRASMDMLRWEKARQAQADTQPAVTPASPVAPAASTAAPVAAPSQEAAQGQAAPGAVANP